MKKYSIPRIYPKTLDVDKNWFVFFRYRDDTGKWHAFKFEEGYGKKINKAERLRDAKNFIKELSDRLAEGWDPLCKTIKPVLDEDKPLIQWLDEILLTKKSLKPSTYNNYEDAIGMFKDWLKDHGHSKIYVKDFTYKHAIKYLDYCVIDRHHSGRTRNNQLTALKTFFYDIFKRDKERFEKLQNPFAGIVICFNYLQLFFNKTILFHHW